MTFDRSSLDSAISQLETAQPPQKSTLQSLGDIIGQITQAGMGEHKSETSQLDTSAHFEQLTELAVAGNSEIFSQLLAAEQYSRKENQPTLLISAVMAGKTEIVRALVAAGADVNIRIEEFFTFDALEFAVDKEYLEIVKILIAAGADLNWQAPIMHPVTKAISKGNIELLKILIAGGAKVVFETGYSLLNKAVEKGDVEILQLLLDRGCELNLVSSLGETALVNACLHGQETVVKFLLEAGADPNLTRKDGLSPIIATFSIPSMMGALSGLGIDTDSSNILDRMTLIIELLIDNGADSNSCDFVGKTALMLAAEKGY
jgi:uncharacterized protein